MLHVPHLQCHASTLLVTQQGTQLCAFYAGPHEGHPEVAIYLSRREPHGTWCQPSKVADGSNLQGQQPCWNPVLFQNQQGQIVLFFKTGHSVAQWEGWYSLSYDDGHTWTPKAPLPQGIIAPTKNKPLMIGSRLLCPSSNEQGDWHIRFEYTDNGGLTWGHTPFVASKQLQVIQPSVVQLSDGTLMALCRSRNGSLATTRSTDHGTSWEPLSLTSMPNPNSGIDLCTLADGTLILACNPTTQGRSPLVLFKSADHGSTWQSLCTLETDPDGEYSYPAIVALNHDTVLVSYTYRRQAIKIVAISCR